MPDYEVLTAFAASKLPHVGTYRRVLPVSLQRMYENALDWEHLPYVHADSFSSIECLDSGPWGWRCRVTGRAGRDSVLELRLDRACRRWITRNLEGPNAGAEIWTHAFDIAERRVDIVVDFFVPDVEPEARDKVGAAYAKLYARLYDEDVAMMVLRQKHLDTRVDGGREADEIDLGRREGLRLPVALTAAGRAWVVNAVDDELVIYPALCPHQLGPLDGQALEQGVVTCPWHGYRFDVRSGECVSGQNCRFTQRPALVVSDGRVKVRAQTGPTS